MLIELVKVLELIENERREWYGSGQDCMGAEAALDNVAEKIRVLEPYQPKRIRGRR